jgi:hypothetical protein
MKPEVKSSKKYVKSEKKESQKTKNEILQKISDIHMEMDKKLAEVANFCFDKNCKVK